MLQGHLARSACHHHCHCNRCYCHCLCHCLCLSLCPCYCLCVTYMLQEHLACSTCHHHHHCHRCLLVVFLLPLALSLSLSLCQLWYATKTSNLNSEYGNALVLIYSYAVLAFVKNCSAPLDLWKVSPPVCECPWRLLIATIILPSLPLSPLWVTLKTIIFLLRNQRKASL